MVLKEKEFCDFITNAISSAMPSKENKFTINESAYPVIHVMQMISGSGFSIVADVGSVRASLGSVRNEQRRFATIDSAGAFLKKIGVVTFMVVNLDFSTLK